MTIRFLNCFTCNARVPATWRTGMLCLLVETEQGLVLVDTGLGTDDYVLKSGILRVFQIITKVPLNPDEAAIHQITRLGYKPEDIRHIVLTHMHFDHCGGLPDFPQATVHVHKLEYESFNGPIRQFSDLAYVKRHIEHQPRLACYSEQGDTWFDFSAIRLPFQPEMWLVPLFGHTQGHCGVAIRTNTGWLFHVADGGPIGLEEYAPEWMVRFVLGPHTPRLREFAVRHPDVRITTGHMWLDFFEGNAAEADL